MNAQDLYDEIKASLKYFGLAFSEMDQVTITTKLGLLCLSHGGRTITMNIEEKSSG